MKSARSLDLALKAARKHLAVCGNFERYEGIVTLYGMTRLAAGTGDPALLAQTRDWLMPFVRGELNFWHNFPNYLCGGAASAYFLWRGHLPDVRDAVRRYADEILNDAPRAPDGILTRPRDVEKNYVWIDVAFSVGPFLLFTGLALDDDRYIEESFQQVSKMVRLFRDPDNGLLHQGRNFNGPGKISEDHWSRGNGWGAFGLIELARHLPDDHPRKVESLALYRDHVEACARAQNDAGLWHQEMTEPGLSYVETSGSALLLYALGSGLEAGLFGASGSPEEAAHRVRFERGLRGLLAYITDDLDIFHTCRGCLCPGNATKLDYRAHPPVLNDSHAFGPVVLAAGQAHLLGLETVTR
ncbi:glycoside hydrolase family 88/105 protein [Geminisphaera colitermitum]|uniref:glycoside hydrolase family 88/105 protein n=1 Tax=Geminisphaera colitermitum TaxID=1148786 RepID=UPI0001964EF9|nr:glycoside hydrolase family 88 protein [Geminisphaera colitermitum]